MPSRTSVLEDTPLPIAIMVSRQVVLAGSITFKIKIGSSARHMWSRKQVVSPLLLAVVSQDGFLQ